MKIGVTLENEKGMESNVCMHFGQCTHFLIADVSEGKVTESKIVPNNAVHGGGGCVAVDEILKYGVTHVISGGMGMGAQQKFAAANVSIFGCTGNVKNAIEQMLSDSLGGIGACKDHGECH